MLEDKRRLEGPFPNSPVPEAVGHLLSSLEKRVGVDSMDRIWIFPPLIRGRKEWGLIAVSCFTADPSQRTLVTGRYSAELTGQGMDFEAEFHTEGAAPPDRLHLVMDGVVRRSDLQLGVPRETEICREGEAWSSLLREFGWNGASEDREDE